MDRLKILLGMEGESDEALLKVARKPLKEMSVAAQLVASRQIYPGDDPLVQLRERLRKLLLVASRDPSSTARLEKPAGALNAEILSAAVELGWYHFLKGDDTFGLWLEALLLDVGPTLDEVDEIVQSYLWPAWKVVLELYKIEAYLPGVPPEMATSTEEAEAAEHAAGVSVARVPLRQLIALLHDHTSCPPKNEPASRRGTVSTPASRKS